MSRASDYMRKTSKENDDIRDAGLVTPADVLRYDDIVYGTDPKWQSLDVYRPRAAGKKKLPVIVSVHGGGWVYGDKERYQYYCMSLAQRGFAVVNFSYRLAPENKFPASLEDTNAVFTWVLRSGTRYGLDPEKVFAVGDSAGAHILGLYCCICSDPGYAARYDSFVPPQGFIPRAIALNCGTYNIDISGNERTAELMGDLLPGKGTPGEIALIQMADHVSSRFPPVFIMTSTEDFLKDQPAVMIRKFLEADVPFLFRYYGDRQTRLPHVFHCDVRRAEGILCNDEECAFFKSFC